MPAPSEVPGDASAKAADRPRLTILKKRAEFLHAARARRQAAPGFLLQARRRAEGEGPDPASLRVGFTCSKKLGNAVARNRAKRRLRALARDVLPRLGHPGWDYVLVGRPDATASRDFVALLAELERAIAQIHRPRAEAQP